MIGDRLARLPRLPLFVHLPFRQREKGRDGSSWVITYSLIGTSALHVCTRAGSTRNLALRAACRGRGRVKQRGSAPKKRTLSRFMYSHESYALAAAAAATRRIDTCIINTLVFLWTAHASRSSRARRVLVLAVSIRVLMTRWLILTPFLRVSIFSSVAKRRNGFWSFLFLFFFRFSWEWKFEIWIFKINRCSLWKFRTFFFLNSDFSKLRSFWNLDNHLLRFHGHETTLNSHH